jgi:indole-3-glycerol phosphate synthase
MTAGSTAPPDLLAAILAATARRVASDAARVPQSALERMAADMPPARGFEAALARPGRIDVIAECKRRSPSRGVLRRDYHPATIAAGYEAHGAAAISVLTEPGFFDGSLDHLRAVRAAVSVPVLRKEFIVDRYQLVEARAAGADAILLIVAALDDRRLGTLLSDARALGLDALVEVHDDAELDRALACGATMVGVNNRNLRTLAVDLDASRRLASRMPAGVVAVAESGIRTRADLQHLSGLGYRAFLVGERFMTADDPGAALAELLGTQEGRG